MLEVQIERSFVENFTGESGPLTTLKTQNVRSTRLPRLKKSRKNFIQVDRESCYLNLTLTLEK